MFHGFMNEKKSAEGFTQIPNQFLDSIYNSEKIKSKVDAISVLIFLVRFLYGNSGTLTLINDYSLSNICKKLGWGQTNTYRLRRTLNALEEAGILKTSLKFGNIVVINIDAEVSTQTNDIPLPKAPVISINDKVDVTETHEENSEVIEREEVTEIEGAPLEILRPPLKNPKGRSKDSLERSNINNDNKFIKNHYSENDDLEEKANLLIELYERSFLAPVTSGHKYRLKEALAGTRIPIDVLMRYIKDLAAHPFTRKKTTSINFIFHVRHAFQSDGIKNFENVAFDLIQHLSYSDLKKEVERQGFCFKTFENYYSEYLQRENFPEFDSYENQPTGESNSFTFE